MRVRASTTAGASTWVRVLTPERTPSTTVTESKATTGRECRPSDGDEYENRESDDQQVDLSDFVEASGPAAVEQIRQTQPASRETPVLLSESRATSTVAAVERVTATTAIVVGYLPVGRCWHSQESA